jgi:hypothetical protein
MNRFVRIVTIAAVSGVIVIGLGHLATVHAARENCPLPDPGIPIPFFYDPVKCRGCEYINEYAAEAAGWDMDAPYCKYLNPRPESGMNR